MRESQGAGRELAAWLGLVDEIREGFPEFDPTATFTLAQSGVAVVFWPPVLVEGTAEEEDRPAYLDDPNVEILRHGD